MANTEIFELPIGVKDKDGTIHKIVEISEMIGADEEAISDKKVSKNPAMAITTLLARKIVKIGDIEKITPQLIKNMFTGDRDMCLLELRKLSLGNDMTIHSQCRSCGDKFELTLDLEHDIVCPTWDNDENNMFENEELGEVSFELPTGYTDKDGVTHKKGIIKFSTGDIEERLAPIIRENPGKANTALITACIKELGDLKLVDTRVVRDLTRRDREYLTKILRDAKCGPDFLIDVTCPSCGNDFKQMIEMQYFFSANTDMN